jgi:hypothetical protein
VRGAILLGTFAVYLFNMAQALEDGAGTSIGLALSAFNPFLFAAWKGVDDGDHRIFWSTLNLIQGSPFGSGGNTWAPQKEITGVGTSSAPSFGSN